ncbi:MAG: transposase [Gemmataceae bacterium]
MTDATTPVQLWHQLLTPFALALTQPGFARFAQWVTGTVLGWEEHTITQVLTSMGLEDRWRVAEHFAEYGAFRRDAVERQTRRVIEDQVGPRFGGYRVVAVDDTKCHRTSERVWGVCTFHEPAGRSPNRASTVRAHNWVVAGDLVPGTPWAYLPHTSRLYFRRSQLPAGEAFVTKTTSAAAMLRSADGDSPAPVLGVFDGAYANATVIGPGLDPRNGRRIDVVTRLRFDARLYRPLDPVAVRRPGRPRKWGDRLPAPGDHGRWGVRWHDAEVYVYGRRRKVRYKERACRWSVTGPAEPVRAFVFVVEGYAEPWFLVTTSATLTAADVVAVFAARFRQEDGFRDHKQRLGMEECRAWTKAPVERTFAVQVVAQTLLRLLGWRLDATAGAGGWWSAPAWNRHKSHPSLLDVRRVVWASRQAFSDFLRSLDGVQDSDEVTEDDKVPSASCP